MISRSPEANLNPSLLRHSSPQVRRGERWFCWADSQTLTISCFGVSGSKRNPYNSERPYTLLHCQHSLIPNCRLGSPVGVVAFFSP